MRDSPNYCSALLWVCALMWLAPVASAGPRSAPRPIGGDLAILERTLAGDTGVDTIGAVKRLGESRDPVAVYPLSRLLRAGQPDTVTDAALAALGRIASPHGIEVLNEFTRHRRVAARRAAYLALAAIEAPQVAPLLARGLRDSDRSVRGLTAKALGERGERQLLELLFVAFARGVPEAALAIGILGDDKSVERFDQHLGSERLEVMLWGYGRYLSRDDLRDETKLHIVQTLGEVSGPVVKRFLQAQLLERSHRGHAALKQALQATIRRIDDGARSSSKPATPAPAADRAPSKPARATTR